jgi:hypothetical protein
MALKQLGIFQTADVYWKSVEDAARKKYNDQQIVAAVEILSDFCDTLDRSGVTLLQAEELEHGEIRPPAPSPEPQASPMAAEDAFPEETMAEEEEAFAEPAPPRQAPVMAPQPQPTVQEQRKASFVERLKAKRPQ